MAREVESSLVAAFQFDRTVPSFDDKILVIHNCEYIRLDTDTFGPIWYWDGSQQKWDDQGSTVAIATSGMKWGSKRMLDFTGGNFSYYGGSHYGQVWGRPTNVNIQSFAMWVQPAYSGSPSSNPIAYYGQGSNNWGGGTYNSNVFYHDNADGKLKFLQWSQTHNVLTGITASSSAWSPVSGTWYLLEVCFDYVNGNQFIYVDGVLVGASSYVNASINAFQREYNFVGCPDNDSMGGFTEQFAADYYVQEIVLYDGLWHTSGYSVDDRPTLQKWSEGGNPYECKFARDMTEEHEWRKVATARGGWLKSDLEIDTSDPKFGGGALNFSNPPYGPAVRWFDLDAEMLGAVGPLGTVAYWFRQNSSPSFADYQYHLKLEFDTDIIGNTNIDGNGIFLYQNSAGSFQAGAYPASGNPAYVLVSNPFTTGQWHHVEFSWDCRGAPYNNRNCWLYIDGTLIDSMDPGTWYGYTMSGGCKALYIGDRFNGGSNFHDFAIDELCFYDEILHATNFTPPTEAYNFDPPPDTRLLVAAASGLARDPKTGLYIGAGIQR